MKRAACALALALAAACVAPTEAHAQGAPAAAAALRRRFGVGTAIGFGASYNAIPAFSPPRVDWGPQADFGTLELRFFAPSGLSVDVYSQLGNTLVSAIAASAPRGPDEPGVLVFASLGVLCGFNVPLAPNRYLLVSPGLEVAGDVGAGGQYERTRPLKGALRVPLRLGVEFVDPARRVGLMVMTRSFLEVIGYTRNDGRELSSPGFAALLEVALLVY